MIKELDPEGTIKTPLNGCLGSVVGVIFYGRNSQSGDKYKTTQNWNTITNKIGEENTKANTIGLVVWMR